MATIQLPPDFKAFLRLLNSSSVEYLVTGGYAVTCHGFPRATADLDIWISIRPENALELLTSISGAEFEDCYARRLEAEWEASRRLSSNWMT